jgi:hypothetical protein
MSKVNLNAVGNANDRLNQHEAKPEMGTNKRAKGSQRSAAGEGIPAHSNAGRPKLSGVQKKAAGDTARSENDDAEKTGGGNSWLRKK